MIFKNKHGLVLYTSIILISLGCLFPLLTIAQEGTYNLDHWTYIDCTHNMGEVDRYEWSFSTSPSIRILVLALDRSEFDAFYNHFVSEYTAILNKEADQGFSGEGTWQPPYQDTWYILYINIDYDEGSTVITIEDSVEQGYYFWEIYGLIIIVGSLVGAIGSAVLIAVVFHYKKKQGIKYCTICGNKLKGDFCSNCGTKKFKDQPQEQIEK